MRLILTLLICTLGFGTARADESTLRVGVLKFGTVNWLMDTIESRKLDESAGYQLEVVALAGKPATEIAIQAGDVDVIVTDWVWAMRQSAPGRSYRFFPFSRSLGALMVRPDAGIGALCDLKGRQVGVVGGPLDKSWLVFQALAREKCALALADESVALFGAPPLMSRQLETGQVEAVSTFWHYAARLEASGNTRLIGVDAALAELGITPAPPLIGFVWAAEQLADRPGLIEAFRSSVTQAGVILAEDDAEWVRLRPLMRAADDSEFSALVAGYRLGIVSGWSNADTAAAEALSALLADIGGPAYQSGAATFRGDVFIEYDGD